MDSERQALLVAMSGRLTSSETLRAVSQAATLAEAVGIQAVCCDVTDVENGPGGSLVVAAMIAIRYAAPMRIAFVGSPVHSQAIRRLIRFSGVRGALRFFGTTMGAEAWLTPVMSPSQQRLSLTEKMHLRDTLQAEQAPAAVGSVAGREAESAA
ncbi:MAG: hypothetical protein ABI305_08555 [Tepidiformaceae bacterium]